MSSYKEAVEWLDDYNPFFVTPILNLGRPYMGSHVTDTLAVTMVDNDVQLHINPDFMEEHTPAECAGLLSHELYHVIMNHLAEFEKFENEKARVIAQECIVNDSVLEEGMSLPDSAIHGMDWVNYNASFLPTKVVYDDLLDMVEDVEPPELICSHNDHEGMNAREIFSAIFNGADVEEASETLKTMLEDAADKAGTGFSFKTETKTGKKISLKWTDLINKIHPETFSEGGKSKASSTWARPRRKLAGMPERVMLPDRKDDNKHGFGGNRRPKILLALDTSGSIPRDKRQELLDLANSIPKRKVDVLCCTFSEEYVPLDINKDLSGQQIASGGTDFGAVKRFAETHRDSDKIHVIVITDGYAGFGSWYASSSNAVPKNLDTHWHWLVFKNPMTHDSRITENLHVYEDYVGDG